MSIQRTGSIRHHGILLLLLFGATLQSLPAAAKTSAEKAEEARAARDAKEAYQKGAAFFNLGQYDKAIELWEEAYRLTNQPSILYNLGQAARLSNNPERAIFYYRGYLRNMPRAPNRDEVEKRIASLEAMIETRDQANHAPPVGTLSPGHTDGAADGGPRSAARQPVASATANRHDLAPTPLYKRWWLWTTVGVVVAVGVGVGVGLGVGLSQSTYVAPGVTF